MTLSTLLADRISQLTAEEDAIAREIGALTDRREDIRMVLVELNQILDRAPLASVPGVASDIVERLERLQLHSLKPRRARRGEVESAVLQVLRENVEATRSIGDIATDTGCDIRSVYSAVTRLVLVGEIIKSGRSRLYLYRANPHETQEAAE